MCPEETMLIKTDTIARRLYPDFMPTIEGYLSGKIDPRKFDSNVSEKMARLYPSQDLPSELPLPRDVSKELLRLYIAYHAAEIADALKKNPLVKNEVRRINSANPTSGPMSLKGNYRELQYFCEKGKNFDATIGSALGATLARFKEYGLPPFRNGMEEIVYKQVFSDLSSGELKKVPSKVK